jgi:hypothetical protein
MLKLEIFNSFVLRVACELAQASLFAKRAKTVPWFVNKIDRAEPSQVKV